MTNPLPIRFLPQQLPKIYAMLKAGVLSSNRLTRPSQLPALPVRKDDHVSPASDELIDAYAEWTGAPATRYRDTLPAHFCSHWAMPLLAELGRLAPYNLTTLLNQGVHMVMHQPIPRGMPLSLQGQLVEVKEVGNRLRIHMRIEASIEGLGRVLDIDSYAAVLLGPRDKNAAPARDEPDFEPSGNWSVAADDGLRFAFLTGDFNPIHTLPAIGRRTPTGSCILHGFGQLAKTWESLLNAGWNIHEIDIRWVKPLPLPSGVVAVEVSPEVDTDGQHAMRVCSANGMHLVGRFAGTQTIAAENAS
ncbi:MAG: MaoC/PaaZ C-terminal domain-containing protein [Paraperlucidibaca sp.]